MIIADTSGLLAAFGYDARPHQQARAAYEDDTGPVIMSPFVLAELDYMILHHAGVEKELELLREDAEAVYELPESPRRNPPNPPHQPAQHSRLAIHHPH